MNIKKVLNSLKSSKAAKASALSAVSLLAVVSGSASAALDPDAQAAFDAISSSIPDYVGAVWPIVAAIMAALVGLKLFKRFMGQV